MYKYHKPGREPFCFVCLLQGWWRMQPMSLNNGIINNFNQNDIKSTTVLLWFLQSSCYNRVVLFAMTSQASVLCWGPKCTEREKQESHEYFLFLYIHHRILRLLQYSWFIKLHYTWNMFLNNFFSFAVY